MNKRALMFGFLTAVAVVTIVLIFGIHTEEPEEDQSLIEGGGMPCMLVEDHEQTVGGTEGEQTASEESVQETVQETIHGHAGRSSKDFRKYFRCDEIVSGCIIGGDPNNRRSNAGNNKINEIENNRFNGIVEGGISEEATETESVEVTPLYTVAGARLDDYLQEYLYSRLKYKEVFPLCLCELFQESQYRSWIISENGLDYGLAQIRITHWDGLMKEAGLYEGDILNPIDNLYVYTYLINKYMDQTGGDFNSVLRMYFNSGKPADDWKYIQNVMQWVNTLERVR